MKDFYGNANDANPQAIEERRARLKTLIVLGKERGYVTFAEINDHLPDEIQESEQIEGIVSMINDMGIMVYEQAPDAEALLMADVPPPVTDEEAAEEAEQALATVDSEFGRTTDPVRMYMREMGTVDLLTREGEIEIAKRIEDGLKHMVQAIAACPTTITELLAMVDKVESNELSVDEVVDGLIDVEVEAPIVAAEAEEEVEEDIDAEEDDDADGAKAAAISAEALAKLREEVLTRFAAIRKTNQKMNDIRLKKGIDDPAYKKLHESVLKELMEFRFSAKQVEALCDSVRDRVNEIRTHERKLMDFCVEKSGMPRTHFIKTFPGNETNLDWLVAELKQEKFNRQSAFFSLMKSRMIRPYRLSKYCIGAIELYGTDCIKYNRFKEKLIKLYEEYGDSFESQISKTLFDELEELFIFLEKHNIVCKILLWQERVGKSIENNKFLKDRLITLSYRKKVYKSIEELTDRYSKLAILGHFKKFGVQMNDQHPSKLCHQLIAENIINNLEKDEQENLLDIIKKNIKKIELHHNLKKNNL